VVAGLKAKGKSEVNMEAWCDEVLTDVSMGELLPVVDEVHVLTSLAGFEALLRNKKVTCYGQPFYAGWGLTQDFYPIHRRTRILTLNQLIAGVLLLYPRYVSRITGEFISPEQAVDDLDAWRETPLPGGPRWYVRLRRLLLRSMS
jgi:capsular polysaccharide export protein